MPATRNDLKFSRMPEVLGDMAERGSGNSETAATSQRLLRPLQQPYSDSTASDYGCPTGSCDIPVPDRVGGAIVYCGGEVRSWELSSIRYVRGGFEIQKTRSASSLVLNARPHPCASSIFVLLLGTQCHHISPGHQSYHDGTI